MSNPFTGAPGEWNYDADRDEDDYHDARCPADGLCQCGCGQPAPIAQRSHSSKGIVKGQPQRFISQHHVRKLVRKTYQEREGKRTHRLMAECALGHQLPCGAEVHHVDGTKNPESPLVICQDHAFHMLLHARARILRAGGDPNTDRICCHCKRVLKLDAFGAKPVPVDRNQCRECRSERDRRARRIRNCERDERRHARNAAILAERLAGMTYDAIAKTFGMPMMTVYNICKNAQLSQVFYASR